jgi:PilZ domain
MAQPRGQRVVATLPVSLDGRTAALSTDISREGFCLETPALLYPGTVVKGTVLHGPLSLAFVGRVAWTKAGDPRACTWHRIGVKFEQLSPGLRALLGLTMRS